MLPAAKMKKKKKKTSVTSSERVTSKNTFREGENVGIEDQSKKKKMFAVCIKTNHIVLL